MSEKETACLRDITETDIMEYMQVEHPHNEKELWKMKPVSYTHLRAHET